MKKTALTILLTAITALAAHAQSAYDAWLFSENNYEGTARSVAMGNAFTALGGDLGAVSINPAGSAVAGYSQLSFTPSLTVSVNTATGAPLEDGSLPYFQDVMKSRMTRAGMPNIGFSFNFETGRTSGLKTFTIAFTANRTNSWCEDMFARGTNSQTSFLAAAAADAQAELEWMNANKSPGEPDFTTQDYMADNAFEYMNWKDVVGYRSGMFSSIDEEGKRLAGASESVSGGNHYFAGEVSQAYGRSVSGNKFEYILNFGANVSDFLYLGINLGMNTLSYDYTHYFKEGAHSDIHDFENVFIDNQGVEHVTYFDKAKYNYSYNADGSGVFAKFGIIVAPGNGFRFGAAVQTPTATTIRETWQEKAETKFSDSSFDGYAESELGRSEYTYRSPWRANFGLAYTLGNFAVVSADYELAGYGGMRYKIDRHEMSDGDIDYFETVNEDIRNMYGAAHYLRAGVEVKPLSFLSVRGGYNLATSAQVAEYDADEDEYYSIDRTYRHNVSLGLGFSSKKSFFADLACRYDLPQKEYIIPYSDYLASTGGALNPEILNRHSSWKVLLTLGWRF
jgi:hypothetical protein